MLKIVIEIVIEITIEMGMEQTRLFTSVQRDGLSKSTIKHATGLCLNRQIFTRSKYLLSGRQQGERTGVETQNLFTYALSVLRVMKINQLQLFQSRLQLRIQSRFSAHSALASCRIVQTQSTNTKIRFFVNVKYTRIAQDIDTSSILKKINPLPSHFIMP